VAVATIGDTLGGMTTYFLGRLLRPRTIDDRPLRALHRWGAGWLGVNWVAALAFMAVGRLSRYIVVAVFA
jgi:membrane protein YqaA with SNARE-associated domain